MNTKPEETKDNDQPFRFFDNREKYLLFVTTTSEKSVIADRVGEELDHLKPIPPALRLFDAGVGNGAVFSRVLRDMHSRFPTVPFLVVGKEISMEDTRLWLETLPDRFAEHPQTVVVLTNLNYSEAPTLTPAAEETRQKLEWHDVAMDGSTAHDFSQEIGKLGEILSHGWQTRSSEKTGNPLYVTPSVLVLYRRDQAFALHDVIPRRDKIDGQYDLIIAAQPYRSRTAAKFKVEKVLSPLAQALDMDGRMIVIQSTGHDPGMEIIRRVWPTEEPFATPRHILINALKQGLASVSDKQFSVEGASDDRALFTYHMHALPDEIGSNIGTSTLLAAWNAAVYVAQIEDERMNTALEDGGYLQATRSVLQRHGGLWFQDESFVVMRRQ